MHPIEEDIRTWSREFLEVPINSVLAARLHYRMNNRPLPKVGEISKYYEDIYAPQTKK